MIGTDPHRHRYADNGSAIRRARRRTGLSQENFALEVGTTRRHLIRLENGEHLPSGTLRDKIADRAEVAHEAIKSADDEEESSSMPLSREEQELIVALFARVAQQVRV